MNEFDIYIESTGSMDVYPGNKMAVFRNLLPEPLQLDGDWRVALAEIIFPSSIKNITTTGYMIYTPKTPYDNMSRLKPDSSGATIVRREDWSNNATFNAGEYLTVDEILTLLELGTSTKKPLAKAEIHDNRVQLKFNQGYGLSFHDRSILNVLGFNGVPDTNRGGFLLAPINWYKSKLSQSKVTFPLILPLEPIFSSCIVI